MKPLSRPMLELLQAMRRGETVRYMKQLGKQTPCFYRVGSLNTCTKTAMALVARGLARFDIEFLTLTERGRHSARKVGE